MFPNIFLQFFLWYFFEVPKKIFQGWTNILRFNIEFFSISLLLKSLFAPWHQYAWVYPRGFDIAKYLETVLSNLIFRILGMIMRIILISFGLLVEVFIFLIGAIVLLTWLLLPLLLVMALFFGLKMSFES